MEDKEKTKNTFFLNSVGDHLGTIGGYEWSLKKTISQKFKKTSVVTRWHGYESIRNDLISMSKPILNPNEETQLSICFINIAINTSNRNNSNNNVVGSR